MNIDFSMPMGSGHSKAQPAYIGRLAAAHQFRCSPSGVDSAGNGTSMSTKPSSISGLAGSQPHTLLGWETSQLPLAAIASAKRWMPNTRFAGVLSAARRALAGMLATEPVRATSASRTMVVCGVGVTGPTAMRPAPTSATPAVAYGRKAVCIENPSVVDVTTALYPLPVCGGQT